ncbi:MAG: Asp-tRNA(Asn)/Glu-tRNA(Gln) amidotransferase GatCAB subunit A, partial [Elusimicrobia bacterium]|nr:Asp-tRNA(Asn)/Glu-tRNA(Gln) amidotransferase GatCAB subunit A [Elusimicrobiota bacterium]
MSDVTRWGAARIAAAVKAREVKAEAVAAAHLDRIRRLDPELRAFVRVLAEEALEAAREVDAAVVEGRDPGLLAGVPVALKDNLNMRGVPTTCGSKILEGFVSP